MNWLNYDNPLASGRVENFRNVRSYGDWATRMIKVQLQEREDRSPTLDDEFSSLNPEGEREYSLGRA